MGQHHLKDEFAGGVYVDLMESRLRIEVHRMDVGGGNQEPNPAATHDMADVGHDLRHRHMAVATALVTPIERKPAQPPTRVVPAIWVQDIKSDQSAVGFDAGHGMRWAAADGGLDLLNRP
jgi:hypothetical protein